MFIVGFKNVLLFNLFFFSALARARHEQTFTYTPISYHQWMNPSSPYTNITRDNIQINTRAGHKQKHVFESYYKHTTVTFIKI
jgi:hypothetical protein